MAGDDQARAGGRDRQAALRLSIAALSRSGVALHLSPFRPRFARRVVCRLRTGAPVRRGDRVGVIRLGSRVELYLPPGSAVLVRPGQKVRAGVSVPGFLPEDSGNGAQSSAVSGD